MNNRIQELAEQAAHDTREKHDNAYWWFQDDLAEESVWREKFAELIIKDVCSKIEPVLAQELLDYYGV